MTNIKTISKFMQALLLIGLIGLPIAVLSFWLALTNTPHSIPNFLSSTFLIPSPERLIDLRQIHWQANNALIGFIADIISVSIIMLGLWLLSIIFKRYANGDIFVSENARDYERLGIILIIYNLLIKPLNGLLTTLAITLNNGIGHRFISLTFTGANAQGIFTGVILIIIAKLMLEASRLADDQKFII